MSSASKRKGAVKTVEWWKHLRKRKRAQNKLVRKDGQKQTGERVMKEIDISMEKTRVYGYKDRSDLVIREPTRLFITENGGHRVQDYYGWVYYVHKDWETLKWLPRTYGTPVVA